MHTAGLAASEMHTLGVRPTAHAYSSNSMDTSRLVSMHLSLSLSPPTLDLHACFFQDLINGFVCTCTMGWTGDTCGENIDECEELSPCKNGSTCSVSELMP